MCHRPNNRQCNVRWELRDEHKKTWRSNGLTNLNYSVTERANLAASTEIVTVDVLLNGAGQHDEVAGQNSSPNDFSK
jgi:hypothetical protein